MTVKTRLLPAVMSILIMTSLFCPVVNAAPSGIEEPELGGAFVLVPAAVAAPEVCEIVISGLVVVISGAAAVEIGKTLGITWDGIAENWNNFLSNVQNELDTVFAKQWVKTANHEGKAAIDTVYEYYTALGSPKGKDDKWYFEARETHGKIEVNLNRLTEEQAVKKMEEGKDIMTLDKALAENAVNRFLSGGSGRVGSLDVEDAHHNHQKADGHYDHLHYGRNANERLHCWIWRNT